MLKNSKELGQVIIQEYPWWQNGRNDKDFSSSNDIILNKINIWNWKIIMTPT